jgi:hypothetical protein
MRFEERGIFIRWDEEERKGLRRVSQWVLLILSNSVNSV